MEKLRDSNIRMHVGIAVVVYIGIIMCSYYIHYRLQSHSQQKQQQVSMSSNTSAIAPRSSLKPCNETIIMVIQFINDAQNPKLQTYLDAFFRSLLSRTACFVSFHMVVDQASKISAQLIRDSVSISYDNFNVTYVYDSDVLLELRSLGKGVYDVSMGEEELYRIHNKWLFYTSLVLHRILVATSRVIMMDIDIELRADVQELHRHFSLMQPHQFIGLAHEQQPVYAHVTWVYRETHNYTLVGDPPPRGLTGFNSGVILMDLDKMRLHKLYNGYLDNPGWLGRLAKEFKFRGHLGDQDVYTLLSFKHKDMFMTLPCQWNRQLCQWWRNKGFEKVFHLYFQCEPPHFVLHGNCNTAIPA